MLRHIVGDVEQKLGGWPDHALTIALLAMATVLVFIALGRSATLKAAALAWVLLP